MANKQHVDLLLHGTEAWNDWFNRLSQEDRQFVDLSGADLSEQNLVRLNHTDRITNEKTLGGISLTGVNLESANLKGANLRGADLRKSDCSLANFEGADLYGANCSRAIFYGTNFTSAYLVGTTFEGADLTNANLESARVTDAIFSFAELTGARLRGLDFSTAHLLQTNFSSANLKNANFSNKDLYDCDFRHSQLSLAKFRSSHLRQTNFCNADLREADFSNARLDGTIFGSTQMEGVRGLDSCDYYGPSVIDHQTLLVSGMLPLNFLRGCGLHDTYIEYLPSLLSEPIQFYSCFISHSSIDKPFCERLYADLQNKGVRTWYFPEDARWGESVWHEIDSSIKVYDKLVVVCSRASLQSGPVLREIERALIREDVEKKNILFPIRLDEFIFVEWEHERKADLLKKVIGNFEGWHQSSSKYDIAFRRLLKSIKSNNKKPKST